MMLASYKSTRPGPQGIANRVIRLRLRGPYSHTEVVFEPGDDVGHLMPDGTCEPDAAGAVWCASSVAAEALPDYSPRRAGKTGGVRFKRIAIDPERWDVVPFCHDALAAAQFFHDQQGALYDWQLILGFVSWVIPHKAGRWTCSKIAAEAGGYLDAWRFDPCNLHYAEESRIPRRRSHALV